MAQIFSFASQWNTTTGTHSGSGTPNVGDLPIVFCGNTGITTTPTVTDDNADGLGTYTLVDGALQASSSNKMFVFVRDAKIGSATSTTISVTGASSTGGGFVATRMLNAPAAGSAAVRQSCKQENHAAGTPNPAFSSAPLSSNAIVGALVTNLNPPGLTVPTIDSVTFSRDANLGFNSPTTGIEVVSASAGITSQTMTWGSSSSSNFGVIMVELVSTPNFTLAAVQGSYVLTGQALLLQVARKLGLTQGSYALTGQALALTFTRKVNAVVGTYALAGQSLALKVARALGLAQGSYTLTGQSAIISKAIVFLAEAGAYVLTGFDAALQVARKLTIGQGAYTLTGQSVVFQVARKIAAAFGSYALTGQDTVFQVAHKLAAAFGSYGLTGQSVGLTKIYQAVLAFGTYVLSGQALNFGAAVRVLLADFGSYALTGISALLTYTNPNAIAGGRRVKDSDPAKAHLSFEDARGHISTDSASGAVSSHTGAQPNIIRNLIARARIKRG